MLTDTERQAAADAILAAEQTRRVCPQPSKTWPGMTLADAYDVQRRWAEARMAAGARIIGRKIGLTSRAMQQASKMTEPDYGIMLDDALFHDGARIPAGTFIKPRLEVELPFVMGQDLSGPGCHVHDVLRATEFVQPALEIIDYPPVGIRGVAGSTRASRYGAVKDYIKLANDEICLLVQVETVEALSRIEEIAAVEGVDGIFVGPADLAASMGYPGEPSHPEVKAAILDALRRITRAGVPAGILSLDDALLDEAAQAGALFIAIGVDTVVLRRGAVAAVGRWRP